MTRDDRMPTGPARTVSLTDLALLQSDLGVIPGQKNVGAAVALSWVLPGLGQGDLGQGWRGAILIFALLASCALWVVGIGVVLTVAVWLFAVVDAYRGAKAINRRLRDAYLAAALEGRGWPLEGVRP